MDYCIETDKLTKRYDNTVAVDGLDLRVEAGSFFGFLGPNGAGKSTTIKMLTGIVGPTQGTARLLGYELRRNPLQIKRRIGVVPEELCLFENLSAPEYLHFVGRMYQLPRATTATRTEELLALLGLQETGKTLALDFSHGMKKKLALAAALIHDPELLFLDEPFEGIDAVASRTILQVLDRIVARGATVFLTSHILEIVEKLCTHVAIINAGKVVRQGCLKEIALGTSLEDLFINEIGEPHDSDLGLSWLGNPVTK
jgi:ABC-2 type transport system ATP-binding protein